MKAKEKAWQLYSNYFEKLFVITHNPLVSNWADNIVKITKENNISSVSQ